MKPVASLLSLEELKVLGSRSNFRYGQDILKKGEIVFDTSNTFHLVAKVKYGNKEVRTVDFLSTPKGLRIKCSCTARKDLFCEHCVAVGLALITPKD